MPCSGYSVLHGVNPIKKKFDWRQKGCFGKNVVLRWF